LNGLPESTPSEVLPLLPDHLTTKGLGYIDDNATIGDLIEMMGCLEASAGLRALLYLEFTDDITRNNENCETPKSENDGFAKTSSNLDTQISITEDFEIEQTNWVKFESKWMSCSYANEEQATLSTATMELMYDEIGGKFSIAKSGNGAAAQQQQQTAGAELPKPVNVIQGLSIKRKVVSTLPQGLVKQKFEKDKLVTDLAHLIKKKHKTTTT
jgi:hypothetical protein